MSQEHEGADVPPSTGPMFQLERRERIMEQLTRERRVDVTELAAAFDVTTETIRRDLTDLQREELVRRVHGGAVPWRNWSFEPRLEVRDSQNVEEKRRIALAALELLPPRGSIIIDSGSTSAHLADLMADELELTVFTNSIPIIRQLAGNEKIDVVALGGKLRRETMAFVDEGGVQMLGDINVDVLFMGCDGVTPERGFTTPYRSEVALKQAMMLSAREVVMMFDHSKLGVDQMLRFGEIGDVDTIITGAEADAAAVASLAKKGPDVRLV